MIIQLEENIRQTEVDALISLVHTNGFKTTRVKTQFKQYVVAIGSREIDIRTIGHQPGVSDVHRVSDLYKLVSRKWKVEPTRISLGDGIVIGDQALSIMAGPCSIENENQIDRITDNLIKNGIRIMRGGVFKPRSSPYTFRGYGIEGLKMFHSIARAKGIRIISEVMQVSQIDSMYDYVDIFQVGARNTQNFNLLDALGKIDKPVLIKRGISGTIDELLQSAEYVFSNGNEKLILCERGIRTYETAYRNTMDINAIPLLKSKTHLPVVADPSHGIGLRTFVEPIALASLLAGADGILVEIHEKPEEAISDGQQTLNFNESEALFKNLKSTFELRQRLAS